MNDSMELAAFEPGNLPDGIEVEEWAKYGELLAQCQSRMQWEWGRWWAYGEQRYGERTKAVLSTDWLGPTAATLANYAWVVRRFDDTTSPRGEVSFGHYKAVAALPKQARNKLITKAEADGLSTRELSKLAAQVLGKADLPTTAPKAVPVKNDPVPIQASDLAAVDGTLNLLVAANRALADPAARAAALSTAARRSKVKRLAHIRTLLESAAITEEDVTM